MAHIWHESATGGEWKIWPLEKSAQPLPLLCPAKDEAVVAAMEATDSHAVRCTPTADGAWLLLTEPGADVRVNGHRLHLGIRLLHDQDHIHLGGHGHYFFSTEQLATVTACPALGRPVFCPRCKLPLIAGKESVQCPSCGTRHHQDDEKPCWTYDATCAVCGQPSALDAGFRWTPKEL